MRVCLMVEGQEGVTWEQWLALARACEDAGLEGMFRSDHYTGFFGGEGGSLDAWAVLSALATQTTRLRLGSLVSPATFRHPSVLARMVVTADHASGGSGVGSTEPHDEGRAGSGGASRESRIELGLGAGWNEDEHVRHGFPFPPLAERLSRFAEQLEIVHRSWTEEEFDFDGAHYELRGCRALPKPLAKPNLIVGGSARRGTVAPAVRFADEYNTTFASPEECRRRRAAVDAACERAGRAPLVFSLMTPAVVGRDRAELEERIRRLGPRFREGEHQVVGTLDEVAARLREYERAGVERVMLQHLLHEDTEMVALLGELAANL